VPAPDKRSGEFRLIAEYLAGLDEGPGIALGNGDDAAALDLPPGEQIVVSTDIAAEGVHFPTGSSADRVAYRAVAAAASDLAAMGARPVAMTLNLSLPGADETVLAGLRAGLEESVRAFGLPLVGGDLVRGPLSLGVQVLGAVARGEALRRSGARAGDRLCVSGCLGDAAAGLALELGDIDAPQDHALHLREAFWRPQPALALGQALRGRATAAIDISDGLLADAGHLSRASGVRLHIDSKALPLSESLTQTVDLETAKRLALTGGEDYQLCFTLPGSYELPVGCTIVGYVEPGAGVTCDVEYGVGGYQHF
jgi:thiamine-monophosphate kinase